MFHAHWVVVRLDSLRLSTLHSSQSLSSSTSFSWSSSSCSLWVGSETSTLCASAHEELGTLADNTPITFWCRTKKNPHVGHTLYLIPIRAVLLVVTTSVMSWKNYVMLEQRATLPPNARTEASVLFRTVSSWHVSVCLCLIVICHSSCLAQSMHTPSTAEGHDWQWMHLVLPLLPLTPTSTTRSTCGTLRWSCFVMNTLAHSCWKILRMLSWRVALATLHLIFLW